MTIDYQYVNFKADAKLLTYIAKKLSKMNTFYDRIVHAVVYLKVEKTDDKQNKSLEIKLNVANQTLFVSEKNITFEAAIDLAIEKLKSQLLKYKLKQA